MWNKNNEIADYIRMQRKRFGMTQKEFAFKSGLGLRFVRELEQGKDTLRIDKVNVALKYFGATLSIKELNRDELE